MVGVKNEESNLKGERMTRSVKMSSSQGRRYGQVVSLT